MPVTIMLARLSLGDDKKSYQCKHAGGEHLLPWSSQRSLVHSRRVRSIVQNSPHL